MKLFLQLIVCTFLFCKAKADLPYMPLFFSLTTSKEIYTEGEKIELILTIKNGDAKKAYPIVLPHTQNTGKKLITISLNEPYQKYHDGILELATEDRNINMLVHDTGHVKIINLQPGDSIQIPFYINDFENYYNYHTQIASHHKLEPPPFVGEYWVHCFYNPIGIEGADTLYNFIQSTNDDVPNNGKMIMWQGGVTATCNLKIAKAPAGIINIQGVKYRCKDLSVHEKYNEYNRFDYYLPDDTTTSVAMAECKVGNYNKFTNRFYYFNRQTTIAYATMRNDTGTITDYWKYRSACPTDIYKVSYNAKGKKTYQGLRWYDNSVHQTYWDTSGSNIIRTEIFSADEKKKTVTSYTYNAKNKWLHEETIEVENPCIMQLDNLKNED
jgi:hypothetical protein